MLRFHTTKQRFAIASLLLILAGVTGHAQQVQRSQPVWWFGGSGAANFNFFRGTTQKLNNELTVPTAFHKGEGIRPYASLLTEYRPNMKWGGMLNIAFDNRGGKFDDVIAPCDCPATLKTGISFISIEPSVRFAPFSSAFIYWRTYGEICGNQKFDYTQESKLIKVATGATQAKRWFRPRWVRV